MHGVFSSSGDVVFANGENHSLIAAKAQTEEVTNCEMNGIPDAISKDGDFVLFRKF
jgi:hypothetical protein